MEDINKKIEQMEEQLKDIGIFIGEMISMSEYSNIGLVQTNNKAILIELAQKIRMPYENILEIKTILETLTEK